MSNLFCAEMIGFFHLSHGPENDISCLLMFHQILFFCLLFVVVQSLNHVQLFVTPWTASRQASLSFTISWSLLKLMSIDSVMPSNHLILCRHLLLPSIFPSIRVFFNESATAFQAPYSYKLEISYPPYLLPHHLTLSHVFREGLGLIHPHVPKPSLLCLVSCRQYYKWVSP